MTETEAPFYEVIYLGTIVEYSRNYDAIVEYARKFSRNVAGNVYVIKDINEDEPVTAFHKGMVCDY